MFRELGPHLDLSSYWKCNIFQAMLVPFSTLVVKTLYRSFFKSNADRSIKINFIYASFTKCSRDLHPHSDLPSYWNAILVQAILV